MTRNKQEYYKNIARIARSSEDICVSIEKLVNVLVNNNLTAEEAHNVKHAFTGIDGKQVDEAVNETLQAEEQEELDTHHDLLHQLVQNLDNNGYQEFCNTHCLRMNDAVEVSNYITDLDYDEVLGIIRELEEKSDDQANEDAIEESFTDTSEKNAHEIRVSVPHDDDYDLRVTACMYNEDLKKGEFSTKKECILDYITNEFGSQGARYTDIIKFAYYLNHAYGPKYGYGDRGYYSMGISGRKAHLITGGNDYLVKGINKDGIERYFALSFVESVTDYWKHL